MLDAQTHTQSVSKIAKRQTNEKINTYLHLLIINCQKLHRGVSCMFRCYVALDEQVDANFLL